MEQADLIIEKLTVRYGPEPHGIKAVDGISLALNKGESLGIIGESGSGKTTLAMAIMGLLGRSAQVSGKIVYSGVNMQQLTEAERNRYRWCRIAVAFQNSLDVLNPVLTIREQIAECLIAHKGLPAAEACARVGSLLATVGLEAFWQTCYPHQLSGGIRQRVLLAMSLACEPDILIVDEPANALDAVAKNEIAALLSELQQKQKFGLIVISHEINIIARLTSRLAVMYKGSVVEEGLTQNILNSPRHCYSRGLLNSSPDINPYRDLWGIPADADDGGREGCPFYPRCSQHIENCQSNKPVLQYVSPERKVACNRQGIVTILAGTGLYKTYEFQGIRISGCEDCRIAVRSGEVAALIGQSGSGKTTLAGILAGTLAADRGEVLFNGEKVAGNSATRKKNGIQIVFQDPYSSVNEHFTVEQAVREPLAILGRDWLLEKSRESVLDALKDVQLPADERFLARKCHTLSGGQRQLVALARALVMEPALLIADEITSMLDPSTQANILRLLKGLQNSKGFAMLYITHDLAVAQKIADSVYVMQQGRIIEQGSARDIFSCPGQSYTRKLVKDGLAIRLN